MYTADVGILVDRGPKTCFHLQGIAGRGACGKAGVGAHTSAMPHRNASAFALADHLAHKTDPSLIGADERHFAFDARGYECF